MGSRLVLLFTCAYPALKSPRSAAHAMMRVLHVTECFGGGVKRAIEARASASPRYEHHLLHSGFEAVAEDGLSLR